jgi:carbamoyl-phosphate synthase large subunit
LTVRVLLTGAGGSASSNVLDAWRRGSLPCFVVGGDASPTFLHLSRADERILLPRADDDDYVEALARAVKHFDIAVVHAQPDPEVTALSEHRDEIGAATFLPSVEAIRTAADKSAFARAMAAASVPVPEAVAFTDEADLRDQLTVLLGRHERVWVRARVGAGARGSLPIRSVDQGLAWIRWWVEEKGLRVADFMASEQLTGAEFAFQSVWQDGELIAGQARERVSYLYGHLTPSGQTSTPSVARTVARPDVDDTACNAIRALDPKPNGIYCVDMKSGVDGVVKVTEINAGRFFTTSNYFAAAGLNMPEMFLRCALGERPARLGAGVLPAGLYWIRMVDMGFVLVEESELDRWVQAKQL